MTHRPLVPLVLGFAAGASAPCHGPAWMAALAAIVLAVLPGLSPLGFASAGWAAACWCRTVPARTVSQTEQTLEGRVTSVPERFEGRVRFVLRGPEGELFLTSAPSPAWPLALDDRIRLRARLHSPEKERNPGGRDRASDLAARGISLLASANLPPVRVAPPSWLTWLEDARSRFAETAARSLPPREAALVRAIGTGDRAALDSDTSEAFARSGLAHILSVSGLHLAVVALGAYRLLWRLLLRLDAVAMRTDPRRIAALAAIPLTGLYALATGADVPVIRAAIAATIALGAILLHREVDALNGLALAALAVLATEPGAMRDPSFQLSFASVTGLVLWSRPLRRAIRVPRDDTKWWGRGREALLAALCASAAASLATAPIVAFHFRRISILSVFSNLLAIPVGSALTAVAALAAVVTGLFPPIGKAFVMACHPLAWSLLALNDLFAAPAWSIVRVGSPGLLGVTVGYVALFAAHRFPGWKRAVSVLVAALAIVAPAPLRHALAQRRGGMEVTFLSVGQGDSAAFLLPDGSAVLVDAGGEARGRHDPGARDIVPWLLDAGITRIAAVFVSHPHPDHLLGLPAVAEAITVERLFTSSRPGSADVAAAWARLPRRTPFSRGEVFERAGVRFEAIGPPPGSESWPENDASLVLRVTHGDVVVLLTGDIEARGEAALVATYGDRLRAHIVKIPHHGSRHSSGPALVGATRPAFAVASVGHENRFGFPSVDAVGRWNAAGASVLRTDAGAIRFVSNGREIWRARAGDALDVAALAREGLSPPAQARDSPSRSDGEREPGVCDAGTGTAQGE